MFEDLAKKDGLLVPRFMLFDIVAHPGCDGWPLTAAKRGAMLRDLRKALPRNCGVHWVGDLTSLRSFLSTQRLPHEVGRVVCLQDTPLLLQEQLCMANRRHDGLELLDLLNGDYEV